MSSRKRVHVDLTTENTSYISELRNSIKDLEEQISTLQSHFISHDAENRCEIEMYRSLYRNTKARLIACQSREAQHLMEIDSLKRELNSVTECMMKLSKQNEKNIGNPLAD